MSKKEIEVKDLSWKDCADEDKNTKRELEGGGE